MTYSRWMTLCGSYMVEFAYVVVPCCQWAVPLGEGAVNLTRCLLVSAGVVVAAVDAGISSSCAVYFWLLRTKKIDIKNNQF